MAVVDPRIKGKPVPKISKAQMERDCVARANKVKAMDIAFLDQRIPKYQRDIINMVGMGVTENAALKPNVKQGATGFSVTYIRAKTGKGAALHRHATEEVFIPVNGPWQVFWLEGDTERAIDLGEGDVVNVPIGIYRGFRSLSDRPDALMMAIVGGPDAGKVDWHPSVLAEARKTGLRVDDDGNLIVERKACAPFWWRSAAITSAAARHPAPARAAAGALPASRRRTAMRHDALRPPRLRRGMQRARDRARRHAAGFLRSTIRLPSSSTLSPVLRASASTDGCQSTLPASGPPTIAIISASGRSLRLRKPR